MAIECEMERNGMEWVGMNWTEVDWTGSVVSSSSNKEGLNL